MKILRESMSRIVTRKFVIRVWRQESLNSKTVCKVALFCDIDAIVRTTNDELAIAKAILKLPRVNAVEVLDRQTMMGTCAYKNWP